VEPQNPDDIAADLAPVRAAGHERAVEVDERARAGASIDYRLVAHVREQPEKNLEARVTVTAPVILEAKLLLILASKRAVIQVARATGGAVPDLPTGEGEGGVAAGPGGGGVGVSARPSPPG
jgi:hypothetical protein